MSSDVDCPIITPDRSFMQTPILPYFLSDMLKGLVESGTTASVFPGISPQLHVYIHLAMSSSSHSNYDTNKGGGQVML